MPCLGSQEPHWSPASADRRLRGRLVAGTYLIEQMVGAGAMGYVYRAVHVGLGLPCAVKVIREVPLTRARRERGPQDPRESRVGPTHGRAGREELVARFQVEARAMSRLDHPNIVRLLDFGRDAEADLWFLVTEHLEGQDLNDVLNAEGALPVGRVVALGRQLCAALQHAHDAGVVHRDVKPDNLRLVPRRDADGGCGELLKLIDFGTAMLVRDAAGAAPAAPAGGRAPSAEDLDGAVIGTPAYMSPEQATGRRADRRSDLYSCGVLLFEMATGRLPFEMPTPISLAAAHAECEPPAPRAVNPAVDPDLERVILWCLRKDPGERPQSARALGEALDQVGAAALQRSRATAAEGPPTLRSLAGVSP